MSSALPNGGPIISRRQMQARQTMRSIRNDKAPRKDREPYARKRSRVQSTPLNTLSDSDDSEDLESTMERDYEELANDYDAPTQADEAFIDDDSDIATDRGIYITQRTVSTPEQIETSIEDDRDYFGGCHDHELYDRLREVQHETPPDDDAGVRSQTLHGIPCISVYDGSINQYLVDDTFINSDMHSTFITEGMCNIITGPMGCGKTTLIKRYVDETKRTNPESRFLYITCLINLCRSSARKLGFKCYLDVDIREYIEDREEKGSFVICINSLPKLLYRNNYLEYTHIILDEAVGIFGMIIGTLIKPAAREHITKMLDILVNPQSDSRRTCVVADALMGEREIDFIKTCAEVPLSKIRIWRFFPRKLTDKLPEIVYVRSKNVWCAELVKALNKEGNRIVLPTSLKDHTYSLLTLLQHADPDIISDLNLEQDECSFMQGKAWFKVDGDTDPNLLSTLISRETILNDHDRFVYTPVLQSGVDFSRMNPYNVGFGLAGTFFPVDTFVQMLRRIRRIESGDEANRAKIYVHIVGEESEWTEDCTIESLTQMLRDYKRLTNKKKELLAKTLGIQMCTRRVITDFFNTSTNENVLRMMAFTLQAAIKFKQNKEGQLRQTVKMNDPNWPYSVDHRESNGPPITAARCTNLLKNSSSEWMTGELVSRGDVLQCSDPEAVMKFFKSFMCLGDKNDISTMDVNPDAVLLPMKTSMNLLVHRCRFGIGMFSIAQQSIFMGTSPTADAYAVCKDTFNMGCMFRELFDAFKEPWKDHISYIKTFPLVMLNMDKLDTLLIDVRYVVRYWKRLVQWHNRYIPVLASNDINFIPGLDREKQPTATQITSMKNIMAACFGLLGIDCKMNDRYKNERDGKRKRQTLSAIVDSFRANVLSGNLPEDEVCELDRSRSVTVTVSEHEVDKKMLLTQLDLATRRDIVDLILVRPGYLDSYMSFDPVPVSGRDPRRTDFDKKTLQLMIKMLGVIDKNAAQAFMDTPSHWILKDADKDASLNALKGFCRMAKQKIVEEFNRYGDPSNAIDPTFLMSDSPGGESDEDEEMVISD